VTGIGTLTHTLTRRAMRGDLSRSAGEVGYRRPSTYYLYTASIVVEGRPSAAVTGTGLAAPIGVIAAK